MRSGPYILEPPPRASSVAARACGAARPPVDAARVTLPRT